MVYCDAHFTLIYLILRSCSYVCDTLRIILADIQLYFIVIYSISREEVCQDWNLQNGVQVKHKATDEFVFSQADCQRSAVQIKIAHF